MNPSRLTSRLSVLALGALLALPVPGYSQVLLSASEFALLGGTAISVGGPGPNPIVNGHVGLSSSATSNITGFPPAVVSGITVGGAPAAIISTGGMTSQAGLDLITARGALFAMAQVPANDLSNLDLGTLAPLGAGVYFSSSATVQTGDLVLDANFQNGVAWVFNFSLSLTTAANSNVTFINLGTNGGSDNGVYWNAATAINIGDNNTIVGNYMAGTSISFTGITTTGGGGGTRALAGAAVSFAGPGSMNVTGGANGGDFDGGLMYDGFGVLVPIPAAPPPDVETGNVLLSSTGLFVAGPSGVTLVPGTDYPTTTLTIDGIASDGASPASLTINTATVTLTGVNTYTGGTFVNTGALIAASGSLPINQPVTLNTSSLTFQQVATGTFGGVISGNGSVNKLGVGALTLTGANTYSGGTSVIGGSLIGNTTSLQGSITNNATVVFNQSAAGTYAGAMSGFGSLSKTGTGALTLSGTNTYTGGTTVSAGSVIGNTTSLQGAIANNAAVTFDQAATGTYAGAMTGTGSLTKTNTGALTLTGANTYSGGTTVSAGSVIGNTTSLQGAIANNAAVTFDQAAAGTYAGAMTGTGSLTKTNTGALTLTGANTYSGGTTVSAGSVIGNTTSLQGAIANNAAVTFNQAAAGTYAGVMSGTGSLTKTNTGALTLSGANTYSGGTTVSAGSVIGNTTSLQGAIANNAAVTFDQAATGTYAGAMTGTGSLTKSNTGALTLSGANTYSGGTTVSAGSVIGNTTSLQGAIANNAAVTFDQATTGTYAGAMTGTGSLTKTNAGVLTLGGTNTYSGGTTVSAGNLVGNTASLQGAIVNNAAVTFNQAAAGTYAGVMSGTGSLVKSNTGTLTLSGANTYSGGTMINAGTLAATTSTLPLSGNIAIASDSFLSIDQAANASLGGTLSGPGTIQKRGAGVLTLANTTTAAADVIAGTLIFNGGLGRTTISNGATLGGSGTITGNLMNLGRLSPGLSAGTINVNGNFAQTAAGNTVIEIVSATSFDRLLISGTASLAGAVQFTIAPGYSPLGQTFTFLTAAGGVTGTFGTVTGVTTNSAAITAGLTYAPTSVTLAFTQVPLDTFGTTPNQTAVGGAGTVTPGIVTTVNVIPNVPEIPGALNAISPQGYEAWSHIAFAHGTALATRLARNPKAIEGQDNFYFDVSQRRGRISRNADVGTTTSLSTAQMVGGDRAINSELDVGLFYEHSKSVTNLGSAGSRSTMKENVLGVRTGWNSGPLFMHTLLAYGHDKYEATRQITFPGTSARASSSTRGHQWFAGVSGGKHFNVGTATVSPFVGLLASRWSANGFTETGAGAFNATLAKQSARSFRSEAGIEAALNWDLGSVRLVPHVRAAWLHEFSNDSRTMNAAFGPANFALATRAAQRDSAVLSGGLDLVLNPRAVIYANYSAQTGTVTKILSEWRVGVMVRF